MNSKLPCLVFALLVAYQNMSSAQSLDIAYSTSQGKTRSVYITNESGSISALVYATKQIFADLDYFASGDRIAVADGQDVTLVSFSVGSDNTVHGVSSQGLHSAGGQVWRVDSSPDGNYVLFLATATGGGRELSIVPSSGGPAKVIAWDSDQARDAVFLRASNKIAVLSGTGAGSDFQIDVLELDSNFDVVSSSTVFYSNAYGLAELNYLEVARNSDKLLFSASTPTSISLYSYDLDSSNLVHHLDAFAGCFSRDDAKIVHRGDTGNGIFDIASGSDTSILRRKSLRAVNWR